MPRFTTIQQRFTQGEIDPLLLGREDIDQYYGGVSTATNVFTIPQGGFKRRPGLEYIDQVLGGSLSLIAGGSITETAPNGGTAANASDQNTGTSLTTSTGISTTNPYVVVHYDLGSAQDIGTLYLYDFALSAGSSSEFYLQVSTDDITFTSVGDAISVTTTAKDFSRRVHGSYRYVRLARIGSTDLTTTTATLTGLDVATESGVSDARCIDFEFNVDQTYKMIVTDKNIAIYTGTSYLIDIYVSDLTEARLNAIDWETDADTLLIFHEDVQTISLLRSGADDVWVLGTVTYDNIPTHDFGSVTVSGTMTPSATTGSGITMTASVSTFTSSMVGWTIHLNDRDGYAVITAYTSGTVVTCDVVDDFDSTTASSDWEIREIIWSSSRGWPRHARFYQGRLWIDGGKSRPSVLYGSVVNSYFNFYFGTALDDEAIGPLTGSFNDIEAIYPGRSLMVYTSKAEWVIPQPLGDAVTPKNAFLKRQTSIGSATGFRPQEVEGGVMYIQRGGKSVQEFIYDDVQQAFTNNQVSLLSSHLIENPVDFALRKATSTEEGAYLLVVKSDGKIAISNIQRNQKITSFTELETDGSFKRCGVDIEDMYFIVQRTINGATVNYLERFNNNHRLDSSVRYTTGLPTDTFSTLDHLEAESCAVIADGAILNNETVSSGAVTIDRNATTYAEIGLSFTPTVTTLPVSKQFDVEASLTGRLVNISEIAVRMKDTASLKINDQEVTFRGFGPSGGGTPLDTAPEEFTGVKRVSGWRGWTEDAQVTISQSDPLSMTILAIKIKVNT